MPVEVSYPGVYVQPIIQPNPPTGGVPTSITVFLGRALMGPVNDPQMIQSLGDYQRTFGALDLNSTTSYMVSDFYSNGGNQGYMTRLYEPYFADLTVYQAAVTVADTVAGQAQGQGTVAAAVAQIQKFIKAQKYEGLDLNIANRVVTKFQALAAQWLVQNPGGTITPTIIGELASQAAGQAAPYGKATININVANTAATAANFVALQAYAAALGSPSDDVPVTTAAKNASLNYDQAPGQAAANYVYLQAQPPQGKTTNAGLAAALNAYFNLPDAVATALDMAASKDPKIQTLYKDYFKPLKYTALTSALKATLKTGATGADVVKAFDAIKLPTDAQSALAGAAGVAADSGESAINTAIAGLEAVVDAVAQQWPYVLNLDAANEGSWGNSLTVRVSTQGITSTVASQFGIPLNQLFNLTVQYLQPSGQVTTESFNNVTVWPDGGKQRLDRVLKHHSQLVKVHPDAQDQPELPAQPPGNSASGVGLDGVDSDPLSLDDYLGNQNDKTGIYALDKIPIFNILCIPPDVRQADQTSFGDTPNLIYQTAAAYCFTRYAMLIIDSPNAWTTDYLQGQVTSIQLSDLGSYSAEAGRSSAVYFPRIIAADPQLAGRPVAFPPCGAIAGLWATTDAASGVWKSPAGLDAAINAVIKLQVDMNDAENGLLNPQGINCLRTFNPGGSVVWGARTLRGATQLADEYEYISVQRTLLYIEDSLLRNTKWAVFEPNDETLWGALRQQITSFLAEMYRQGAFPGPTAKDSYFVKCDASTNPPDQVAQGIVNVQVGFAPLYPAEFVVITIQQIQQSSS